MDEHTAEREVVTIRRSTPLRTFLVLVGAVIVVLVVRVASTTPTPRGSVTYPAGNMFEYQYSCCGAKAIDTTYHPGQTMRLHWTSSSTVAAKGPSVTETLTARVTGPFASVAQLKAASSHAHPILGTLTIQALPRVVSDTLLAGPVSIIRIPTIAVTGYYNLTMTMSTTHLSVSGSSVIRIASSTRRRGGLTPPSTDRPRRHGHQRRAEPSHPAIRRPGGTVVSSSRRGAVRRSCPDGR